VLHESFVYLDEIDNSILYDIRYAGKLNFLGEIVDGYRANRPVVTKVLGEVLSKIQRIANKDGYSLVVYETYRPQRATDQFVKWAEDLSDIKMQKLYYPYIDKSKVFDLGFIAKKSAHSRGSTVDLTLIGKGKRLYFHDEIAYVSRRMQDGREFTFIDDGTVDMGSHFDLFDEASLHQNDLIDEKYLERRRYLRNLMIQNGFDDYSKEWWHYRYMDEPYHEELFDFEIV
jgi:zinc D-Ala-D-Ala dipeptidase